MRFLFLLFLLPVPFLSIAQQDTIQTSDYTYIDKNVSGKKNVHVIFNDPKSHKKGLEGDYLADKRNGIWVIYNTDGTVIRQQSYKEGVRDGIWFVHQGNGYIERKEEYKDGILVIGHCYDNNGTEIPYFKEPLTFAEKMPTPSFDLPKYLRKNLHYPGSSKLAGTEGQVIVKFIVNEDGTLSNITIVKGLDSACNEEARRLIKEMKPWNPGMQDGKNASVYYAFPLTFK